MMPRLIFSIVLMSSLISSQAAGRQLTGPHAPASSDPLPPAQAKEQFQLPSGFEAILFAAEPDVINPVAMSWDARGRLWVLELFEYPRGAQDGAEPRDKIKILEDTDLDGRADKVTVFAKGLNLATGLLLGDGGAYVGQAPHLLFLKDTDGDDVADVREVLLSGFGLEDRHELLNGFTWGPDGWLYMTHGVFTHSRVRPPDADDDDGVVMNAAVARFHPKTRQFEIFADGTSNPWGVDFDRFGNAFVSACVIDHLFHMAPGGHYARQAGQPAYPFGYELIPSIVDHRHYRAAYAGVQVYQGHQYPAEYLGRIMMGNIHDNAVNQDALQPAGATFKATAMRDFLKTDDGWFRPVAEKVGPDGALWIMDWYDKYPCYQNAIADPEGVDRDHGRIWRIVYTGNNGATPTPHPRGMNLNELSARDLVDGLRHPNVWQRRMAQKLLSERNDESTKAELEAVLSSPDESLDARLAALWTLHSSGHLSEETLDIMASDSEEAVRVWVARFTGERRDRSERSMRRLYELADDPAPTVRAAVATACRQYVSSSLTINTPLPYAVSDAGTGPVLARLVLASAQEEGPLLPFLIWMAVEPYVADDPTEVFTWLVENGEQAAPLSLELSHKAARRAADTGDNWKLELAADFIRRASSEAAPIAVAALDGLLEAQRGAAKKPARSQASLFAALLQNPDERVQQRALRLGALWGDERSVSAILNVVTDSNSTVERREAAIEIAGQLKSDTARQALLEVLRSDSAGRLAIAAIRSLQSIGGDEVANALLNQWKIFKPAARRAAAEALASRAEWVPPFLKAFEDGKISPGEAPVTVIRSLARHRDDGIRRRAEEAIGRFREPDADMEQLIARKKQAVLSGPIDIEAGRKTAEAVCLTCHKLHGAGAEVGPDLTGVGRSTLDALLANVINPNQIIGSGYENVEVETKDGRAVSGRLVEETSAHLKILSAGPREEVISKEDIASRRVTEISVMPEGLEQMPDQDFRNLIWYILNPPEDERELTPELRRELVGETPPEQVIDWESVSLWNPDWKVSSREGRGAPEKLPEYKGRSNVLVTHPFWHQSAAALESEIRAPSDKPARLQFEVAARENGRWVLRVFANKQLVHKQLIEGDEWKNVSVDLSRFAGQRVGVRIENFAYNLENDFAYWRNLRVE